MSIVIDTDTTWTPAGSPYLVTRWLRVEPDAR